MFAMLRKADRIDMRYDISCASDVYRNWISVSLVVFRGSTRGGVIQYSKSFPSKNKTDTAGVGRLDGIYMRRFDDGVTYVYTTCSYDRFRMDAILVCRLRSWRIWIPRIGRYCPALQPFQNRSPLCLSIDKNVSERGSDIGTKAERQWEGQRCSRITPE